MSHRQYARWSVTPDDLREMDAVKARDLVVECFYDAQRETFMRAKENLGVTPDEVSIRRSVKGAVRLAFATTGGDFDAPTCQSLMAAIGDLAAKAATWGTPPDVIDHHRSQIEIVLAELC